jgi:hypothetical protein
VITLSTSGDASAGVTVITCTWLLVISGNASTGSFVSSMIPQMIQPTVNRPTISLLRTENLMIAFSIVLFIYENYELDAVYCSCLSSLLKSRARIKSSNIFPLEVP